MSKLKVVNLFAGAGAGKSTGAAYIFYKLKTNGINCELVTEFAKDKVWENNSKVFENQAYILGKQSFKISRLIGEVDIVITDSPLLLSVIYNNNPILGDVFNKTVLNMFNNYDNLNYFINRTKDYNPKGRLQTFEEAKEIDKNVLNLLHNYNISYKSIDGQEGGYDQIVEDCLRLLI